METLQVQILHHLTLVRYFNENYPLRFKKVTDRHRNKERKRERDSDWAGLKAPPHPLRTLRPTALGDEIRRFAPGPSRVHRFSSFSMTIVR